MTVTHIMPALPAAAAPRRSSGEQRAAMVLVVPAVVLMIATILGPGLAVVLLSVTDYNLGASSIALAGLDNYREIAGDATFRASFFNTLVYVAIVVPLSVALGLFVAVLIHASPRFRGFYATVYFLPVMATLAAMAVAWEMVLHPTIGIVNQLLAMVGIAGRPWLRHADTALPTLAVIGIWQSIGFNVVLFLAGLSTVPQRLYEAAVIDGARTAWSRFWIVTWPMLGPALMFVTVITATRAFQVFDTVAVLTRGGPNNATEVLLYTIYREGFGFFRTSVAAAMATVFLLIVVTLTLIQARLQDRKVHYQ